MPPLRKPTPSYVLHNQSGRARAVWYDAVGARQQKLLPGPFNSSESRAAFARLQRELEAAAASPRTGPPLAELMVAYPDHAECHYRGAGGNLTGEFNEIKLVIKALQGMYAETPPSSVRCG